MMVVMMTEIVLLHAVAGVWIKDPGAVIAHGHLSGPHADRHE